VKVCIDDAATKRNWWKVHLIPLAARYCPGKSDAKRVGAEWVLEETCELSSGGNLVRLERKTTISGDSQSTIEVRIEDKGWRGGSVAPFQARTVRWVAAACTDGMKPGDTKEFRREGRDTRELTTEELKEYRRVYP
jgi:hypothetical protein